tara:strand:+ start:834 stop:1679 length:846 start_codon:yes stop_codon:yes gene_type:complete
VRKKVHRDFEKIVIGCDTRALLYAYTNNITCFYVVSEAPESVFRPKNVLIQNFFSDKNKITGEVDPQFFILEDKLDFVLKLLLNCGGKLYQIDRDNLRYDGGQLRHKSNKTEYNLNSDQIYLFDNIKLNGSTQKIVESGYVLEDRFRLNTKSIDKTYFCLGDEFLNHAYIEGKNLESSLRIADKKLLNDFSYSSVTVRYHLEELLKGNEDITLERTYYVNLKMKLQKRTIIKDFKYYTEENNIINKTENLEELCQNKILPSQESYLYYLTKKILDFHGTTH